MHAEIEKLLLVAEKLKPHSKPNDRFTMTVNKDYKWGQVSVK